MVQRIKPQPLQCPDHCAVDTHRRCFGPGLDPRPRARASRSAHELGQGEEGKSEQEEKGGEKAGVHAVLGRLCAGACYGSQRGRLK
jgi:hypothetical protein